MIPFRQQLQDAYNSDSYIYTCVHRGNELSLTYKQLLNTVNEFTSMLIELGVNKGDKVITSLTHNFDWNIIEFSLFGLGAIHVPLAPDLSVKEFSEAVTLIRPSLVITNSSFHYQKCDYYIQTIDKNLQTFSFDFNALLDSTFAKTKKDKNFSTSTLEDIAVILFTSGSTSLKPKAVALSYKNILTAVEDFSALDLFEDVSVYLDILPHSFSGGRKVNYAGLLAGLRICYANSTWSLCSNINHYKAELVACVPLLVKEIISYLNSQNTLPTLKKIICGGAPLNPEWVSHLKTYGIELYNVYGLTETTSLCAYNTQKAQKIGSLGKFSRKVNYTTNEQGELLLQGDSIAAGYFTADGLVQITDNRGWFNTHDIVSIDEEGFLFLTGRSDGLAKSNKGKFYKL